MLREVKVWIKDRAPELIGLLFLGGFAVFGYLLTALW